jgi:hypothetical protein
MPDPALGILEDLPGIALVPVPIERLGLDPELNNEVPREVLRFNLASLFAPEPNQGRFVPTNDDSGV